MALSLTKEIPGDLEGWKLGPSLLVPLAIVMVLGIMILPVPAVLMDLLLSLSITLSITILLVGICVKKPLDFSVFPVVLLVATLYRLSLNIASTRLVLLRGEQGPAAAGKVIASFGQFVVGGDYVVGLVVFIILVLINFMVITKGAGRIAEVAARFTLDAMPGKQMSIDADLNAGLIEEAEARRRREEIAKEADFYGAMDGASKFVRGDAIAGILITVVNIVGGLMIGIFKGGLSVSEAAKVYTLLTVGDGLVSQIPALFVSTAAGLIVSRTDKEGDFARSVFRQLFGNPVVLYTAAAILLVMGLVPGMPHFSFLLLAAGVAFGGYMVARRASREALEPAVAEPPEPERPMEVKPVDLIALDVGYRLVPMVDEGQGGTMLERIRTFRKQMTAELGFLIPSIHIKDNLQIAPSEYRIYIKEIEVARGEMEPGTCLAINPGKAQPGLEGSPTKEPVFGLSALCISENHRERAQMMGYTVVDATTVLVTHLLEVIRQHAHELLTRQDVHKLLVGLSKEHAKVVEELTPALLPLSVVHRVLQNLLEERVSIRDLLTITETLGDVASVSKDPAILTEYVRQSLARQISREFKGEDSDLVAIVLDPHWEEKVSASVVNTDRGSFPALDPAEIQKLVKHLHEHMEVAGKKGHLPVLLTSPELRRHVRRLLQRWLPKVPVLSYNEITPDTRLTAVNR